MTTTPEATTIPEITTQQFNMTAEVTTGEFVLLKKKYCLISSCVFFLQKTRAKGN